MSGDGIVGTTPSVPRNGLPEFVPYVYRGTGKDELTAWMDEAAPLTRDRILKPHGTLAAYKRHLRHGETPCIPCTEANRIDVKYRNGGDSPENARRRETYRQAREAGMTPDEATRYKKRRAS